MTESAPSILARPQRRVLSTSGLKQSDKLAEIRKYVAAVYALQVEIEDVTKFSCEWLASRYAGCILTRARIEGDTASRARRTVAPLSLDAEYFKVIRVRTGRLEVEQHGIDVALGEDQFLLMLANEPYQYIRPIGTLMVDVARLPSWLLRSRLSHPEKFLRRPYPCGSGLAAITMDFIDILQRRMHDAAPIALNPLLAQLADLVALTLMAKGEEGAGSESSVRAVLLERISRFIGRNLANRDLTPGSIAAANGISERYLHRVFQESGRSVCDYIRSQRVAVCRRALEDPLQLRRSIAQIGYANGFRSASQFARAYRREFGVPPSAWRERSK